jgi:hypothetical protein
MCCHVLSYSSYCYRYGAEHHEVAHNLSSQCHTWADQFIPIISRWAMRPEWNAWVLNSDLRRTFGLVLSPVLKDSKTLSLEGLTRRQSHPMLLRDANRIEFDHMSLNGVSIDRGFEIDSAMETPQEFPDFGSSSELPLNWELERVEACSRDMVGSKRH